MDMLRDNVRAGYRKYFLAAFGSALIRVFTASWTWRWSASIRGRTVRRRCRRAKTGPVCIHSFYRG